MTEDDINDIDNVEGKLGELQEDFQAVSHSPPLRDTGVY